MLRPYFINILVKCGDRLSGNITLIAQLPLAVFIGVQLWSLAEEARVYLQDFTPEAFKKMQDNLDILPRLIANYSLADSMAVDFLKQTAEMIA